MDSSDVLIVLPSILMFGYVFLPGWWYTYPSEKYESQLG